MIESRGIAIPESIEETVRRVELVERELKAAYEALDRADKLSKLIGAYAFTYSTTVHGRFSDARKKLHAEAWKESFSRVGLNCVMDRKAIEDFKEQLKKDPPDFNMDNIRATFVQMAQDAETIFRRGLVGIFERLTDGYASNRKEPFAIPEKMILTRCLQENWQGGYYIHHRTSDELNDIDRVVSVVLKRPFKASTWASLVDRGVRDDMGFEDEYFKIKAFMNGNLHIKIKSKHLRNQINNEIAAYFGENAVGQKNSRRAA